MTEVVSVLHALMAADDIEQVVLLKKSAGDVGAEDAGEAAVVGEPTLLFLKKKRVKQHLGKMPNNVSPPPTLPTCGSDQSRSHISPVRSGCRPRLMSRMSCRVTPSSRLSPPCIARMDSLTRCATGSQLNTSWMAENILRSYLSRTSA